MAKAGAGKDGKGKKKNTWLEDSSLYPDGKNPHVHGGALSGKFSQAVVLRFTKSSAVTATTTKPEGTLAPGRWSQTPSF